VDKEDGLSVNTMGTAGNSGLNKYEMQDWNTKSSVKQSCCSYHCPPSQNCVYVLRLSHSFYHIPHTAKILQNLVAYQRWITAQEFKNDKDNEACNI
jgi:hypothetical protein